METNALTINQTEIRSNTPIGLQYFQSVDAITNGLTPDKGKYFNILVYEPGKNQPQVKILRLQSEYPDGKVGKQDEVRLIDKQDRLQFNAECDSGGNYIKYPETLSKQVSEYLDEIVKEFIRLANVNGSIITINGIDRMVSSKGVWWIIREKTTSQKPQLDEPKKQLPQKPLH